MKRTIQNVFWGFTVSFLVNNLFVCAAQSQTVDSFNVNCTRTSDGAAIIQTAIPLPNGKILAGGACVIFVSTNNQSHTDLARLNSDGSVDDSFSGISLTANFGQYYPCINCVTLQTNGQVLVGGGFAAINGQTRYNIGRLNTNGTLDTLFNPGNINGGIGSILPQSDGKILVGGSFTTVNSQSYRGLCRLNIDGSLDTNFNAGANNSIVSLALQADGKILAEGSFTSIGGQSRTNLARLNSDGSLDPSFQSSTFTTYGQRGISGIGGVLSVQSDGKVLVGALFDRVNGLSHTNIVRFNSDGTLDTNFNAQADFYNCWGLQTIALQTDGKILVGNDSLTLDGQRCPYLGRLNADGSLDASFSTNLVSGGTMVFSSIVQLDGRILAAGWFGSLGGLTRNEIGRLVNIDVAAQSLNSDGTNILWLRGGTSPEVWRTAFEASIDGTNWTCLGDGFRVNNGWQLTNVFVAANATIRARGFVVGGRGNGSSWFVESIYSPAPRIVINDEHLGFRTNRFGFNLSGGAGSAVIVDASSNMLDWVPIVTNTLPCGSLYFNDPTSTNFPQKFYRARLRQ